MGCGGSSTTSNNTAVQDPLAPGTGGAEARARTLGQLGTSSASNLEERAAQFAGLAASDPGLAQGMQLQRNTGAGQYLGGTPQLERALAPLEAARSGIASIGQGASAAGQDAAAGVRSGFQKAGMSFGTGNQQAQQADQSAAAARMAEQQTGASNDINKAEAAARLQNYAQERENQNTAGTRLGQLQTGTVNMLGEGSKAAMQPLQSSAEVIRNLTSGTPVTTSSNQGYNPGAMDYAKLGIGTVGTLGG